MKRAITTTGFALSITTAVVMFHIKYQVVDLEKQLSQVHQEIFLSEESIHLLHSEWAYLNTPSRLQELSAKYLQMVPSQPIQLISMERFAIMPSDEVEDNVFDAALVSIQD